MIDLAPAIPPSLAVLLIAHLAGAVVAAIGPWRDPVKNWLTHGAAVAACTAGVLIGIGGLLASEPLAFSLPSTIPLLHIQLRLDPLSAFFVLIISVSGVAVTIYALGYVREFYGRHSIRALRSEEHRLN